MAHPWNVFLSYSESGSKEARKRGWKYIGTAKDLSGREVRVYKMFSLKKKKK